MSGITSFNRHKNWIIGMNADSSPDIADMSPAQLFNQIGRILVADAPSGWQEILLTERYLFRRSEEVALATLKDGRVKGFTPGDGFELIDLFTALRKITYQPGKGAWFTAKFKLTIDGKFSIDYDYDNEPEWDVPIVPETYAEDLERFPRAPEYIPEWLQEKLREAGHQ
ncbi:immunity protein YezG family protein [Spirillospora sp. CA-255316]